MRIKIFRWKAIGPLLLLLAILTLLVIVFAEPIARDTTEEASTELLGTQVDVGKLDLFPREASVDLQALQIADPFALTRNLIEADEIRLKLNPAALANKKLVIENLSLTGRRFGTDRKTPARPVKGGGFAPKVLQALPQGVEQLERSTKQGVQLLGQGTQLLDQAREKDFAFAKSLLKLPTFNAPDIGSAFFGEGSIERFKQALYWAELAQQYMPPGLLPRPAPGPQRLRAAGHTIEGPREQDFPRFLLEQGSLDFTIGGTRPVRGA